MLYNTVPIVSNAMLSTLKYVKRIELMLNVLKKEKKKNKEHKEMLGSDGYV